MKIRRCFVLFGRENHTTQIVCVRNYGVSGKQKKKFKILIVRQNLFTISFEDEEDLEQILEGQPWFFRKQLIIFNRLSQPVERSKM